MKKILIKAMQLIGFNYKATIWEPLTIVLKNLILSKAPTIVIIKLV